MPTPSSSALIEFVVKMESANSPGFRPCIDASSVFACERLKNASRDKGGRLDVRLWRRAVGDVDTVSI